MTNNPFPIQIKKRILLDLVLGVIRIFLIVLIFGISFIFVGYTDYNFHDFFFSIITIVLIVGGIMLFILIVQIIWNLLYLNSIEYLLDNKNLTFKGGVISRFEKVIPYSKIQHAIIYESFWQRILGLSSVSIETAREGGGTPGYNTIYKMYGRKNRMAMLTGPFIPDLNKEDAKKLKNYIISVANKYKSVAGI